MSHKKTWEKWDTLGTFTQKVLFLDDNKTKKSGTLWGCKKYCLKNTKKIVLKDVSVEKVLKNCVKKFKTICVKKKLVLKIQKKCVKKFSAKNISVKNISVKNVRVKIYPPYRGVPYMFPNGLPFAYNINFQSRHSIAAL